MTTKKIKIIVISILSLFLSILLTRKTCMLWFDQNCIEKISETLEKAEEVERNLQEIEVIEETWTEFE